MENVRWGIIGCGSVTEVKSGPAFQKAEGSKLIAVMRRNKELAKDYALRHGVPKWYDKAEDLINDPEVDAIYIATPPVFHKEYVLQVAKAKKPVYVEKPMAMNAEECMEMIQACEEAKIPLFTAYYRRALPRFLKIKEWIDSGKIGEVRFVTTVQHKPVYARDQRKETQDWHVKPEISGGGYFHDLACHTLDILDFLLGPIIQAKGIANNQGKWYDAPDCVTGVVQFESGVHGMGMWNFSAYDDLDENKIIGDKGEIMFSTFGDSPIVLTTKDREESHPIQNPIHIQLPLIQTIVNQLRGEGFCPSSGENGVRTAWVMDELTRS